MKKEITIVGSLLLLIIIIGFVAIGSMFSLIGSDTERLINTNQIELHMYPQNYNGYCKDQGAACTSAYRIYCNPYVYTRGDGGMAGCTGLTFQGAERKLIGEFCAEKPILKIYSATADMYFEDYYGGRSVPVYIGMTDNSELSNQNSTISATFFNDYNSPRNRIVGYNANIMTEYVKGEKCFNLYATGGGYYKNSPFGNDVTIEYIDMSYDPVECMTDIECNDNMITTDDSCNDYVCQYDTIIASLPTKPAPTGLSLLIQDIQDWINITFANIKIFISFSIVGEEQVEVGSIQSYNIDLTTTTPDSDYTDGYYETQYAYWALIDKNSNIIEGQTIGVEVFGNYNTNINITIPNSLSDNILLATITQIESTYNFTTKSWTNSDEIVIQKEALNIQTKIPIPDKPPSSGLSGIITSLIDWFKSIFNIFGW